MLKGSCTGVGVVGARAEHGRRDCNIPGKRCNSSNQVDSNGAGKKWSDSGSVWGKGPTGFAGRLAQEKERREMLNTPLVFCGC